VTSVHKTGFFPRLALVNLVRNGRFYGPYLLTVICSSAAYYIVQALASSRDLPAMTRYAYLSVFMTIGTFVIALFSVIFLTYTNGFLMKRRKRELGLYNILGLGKGHMAVMLGVETAYTAAAGIGGGILLGLLLQKLVTLLLCKIMAMDDFFGFYVSWSGIWGTVVLFGLILLGNLLGNLLRMGRQSPMELLREGGAGEREPKTNWPAAILGVLSLGGGYGIALFAKSAGSAFALYFPAVFLVIIGTYCLFSAVSIAALKALRKNRGYYYRASHFINVSGMLYRMRRNAVGLANICILSTMVLVMVSGTLSLYLNSRKTLEKEFPGNVAMELRYDPEGDFDPEVCAAAAEGSLDGTGYPWESLYTYRSYSFLAEPGKDGSFTCWPEYRDGEVSVKLISAEDYRQIFNREPGEMTPTTFRVPDGDGMGEVVVNALDITAVPPAAGGAYVNAVEDCWLVVEDTAAMEAVHAALDDGSLFAWTGFWQVDCMAAEELAVQSRLEENMSSGAGFGAWIRLDVDTRQEYTEDYYALNGGFFFLGLFLGLLFIMAAVLIIYYKQLSEGYEDRERFVIMQKVGMEPAMVRRCVNSQILLVFFAPLMVSAVHVAFDYQLMVRLLTMFGLHEPLATLGCTAAVFLCFAALYALVYRATARAYYRIVGGAL